MDSSERSVKWLPYIFLAPAGLYLLVFQAIPLAQEMFLSLTSTSLLSPRNHRFVGLDNYISLFTSQRFAGTLWVTFIYTVSCVVLAIGIGFVTALLLDSPFRGRGVARALIAVPWAAPSVAVAIIATWIFNAQYGIFNHAQRALGIPAYEGWLDSPQCPGRHPDHDGVADFPVFVGRAACGAAGRPRTCARRQPSMAPMPGRCCVPWCGRAAPTVILLALFVTIWSLRRFDLIWLLTQGGPVGSTNTLVIDLYQRAFVSRDLGAAAAVGMVGLAIALVVTLFYIRANHRADQAER